ncbi:MAG TPA: response regulator transcription factor [Ornithinimicrobium sp.]|uniref:response regulator transcription factor n=1 Tax=Ornithinimicrobium sp. TaxID=1977084 RepID=UPI002B470A01|nr:response regulator transcription factor [Ornithinimicrobium sp.]HKJ11471.1 response regulator transcription factor [Ornithinimicrobium sp.]
MSAPRPTVSVVLVDDQPLLRSGFSMILSTEPGIEVVGTAADGAQGLSVVRQRRPDVVLMDIQMPVLDGIEATREILSQAAADRVAPPRVVMLTTFDRDDYLFDALAAGASGFLLKNADAEELVQAIRTVRDGHALLAPEVTRRVIGAATQQAGEQERVPSEEARRVGDLTAREREVLAHLAGGQSNAEIARTLYLSEATVKTHVSNVLSKLGVRDRVQAVVVAYRSGLVPPHG